VRCSIKNIFEVVDNWLQMEFLLPFQAHTDPHPLPDPNGDPDLLAQKVSVRTCVGRK